MIRHILLSLTLLVLAAASSARAGEKEGHGGDPLVADFYKRGQFILNELRRTRPIERPLIEAFAEAFHDLSVDITDATLPNVGRVLADPDRPGKRFVLLDRQKYLDCLVKNALFDLNSFVAHEIYETWNLDLSPGYGITRRLRFSETQYRRWYARYAYTSVSPNPVDRFGAIAYSFETGLWSISWDAMTSSEAEANAMSRCAVPDCQVLSTIRNGCLALAKSVRTTTLASTRWSVSRSQAEKEALAACTDLGETCERVKSVCTSYAKP
jgi:hypothetical protein